MRTKTSGKHYHKIAAASTARRIPDCEVFVENSTLARHHIKARIIKGKLIPYECAECALGDMWNGKKLSLQLDHRNGKNNDGRLENLRFLCANCHSQQITYAGKNKQNTQRVPKPGYVRKREISVTVALPPPKR